ncbi:unnamed protein product [Acanthoscelides obtectus]|uniref:Very-long-chain (3R)-3-hydroxyacyl-CoA dehydratase n=1 Tax=Acanthoscelides obtectus TaxID=200917 RepID=A0A9P0Q371_ACAOB|nr:unnamed protein product [Acanthoscelides obtectus]CAK1634531.1 Very-long-chain (3R)-3-hydroxyacyl-CoA dehydratase hpo-8 [Acanthoscelides obtectus]
MAQKSSSKSSKKAEPSALANLYLIAYNVIQAFGWSYLLYQLITYYLGPSTKSLYETVKWSVIIFQNAAVLEVVHAFTGLVRSNPIITAAQIASRVVVVCGVLMVTQAARDTVGMPMALLAWSVAEIIRYSTYAFTLLGGVPYFLKWLRYSTFIVLYPIGVTGEQLCMYAAQKEVGEKQLFSYSLPNSLNFIFSYQYFLILVMLTYIPFFPQLYLHMFSQRRKALGDGKKEK